MIKMSFAIGAILLVAVSARSGEADRKPLDEEFLRNYMAGEYDLIGRKVDSTATYNGHVTFLDDEGVLQVTRTIHGKTDKSAVRYFDGKEYEATYRWQSDRDNYPRLTGYLYLSGTKSPGLEALFPIHK
jgi:hypothetical protein